MIESMITEHNALLNAVEPGPETADTRRMYTHTRVNFTFDPEVYYSAKEQWFRQDAEIVQMTGELFDGQSGAVIPRYFWRDAEHFLSTGIGYTLLWKGRRPRVRSRRTVQRISWRLGLNQQRATGGSSLPSPYVLR